MKKNTSKKRLSIEDKLAAAELLEFWKHNINPIIGFEYKNAVDRSTRIDGIYSYVLDSTKKTTT